MNKCNSLTIYSIVFDNGIETSSDIEIIKSKASKFANRKIKASILKNGSRIGWIGEDLTQRLGWGWYIMDFN